MCDHCLAPDTDNCGKVGRQEAWLHAAGSCLPRREARLMCHYMLMVGNGDCEGAEESLVERSAGVCKPSMTLVDSHLLCSAPTPLCRDLRDATT